MLDLVYGSWVASSDKLLVVPTCSVKDDIVVFNVVFSAGLSVKSEVSKVFCPVVISGTSLVLTVDAEVDGISLVLSGVGVMVDAATATVVSCRLFAVVVAIVVCVCKVVGSVVAVVVADVVVATEL